ncbi:MAG: N-acetylmuramoyl-L-alanine amidase [Clostridia bacterium]|nr:N-acetylmuramoyl-L-alanine amidase [Clostridia bacterium]
MSEFLKANRVRLERGIIVHEKFLPPALKPNRQMTSVTPQYVTIHNTSDIKEAEGTNDAEQYARATHNVAMGGVSVHYYIDESDCWQLLREDEMGFHAADGYGPGNGTSIAIEIIMDGSGSKADVEAEERGAILAASLLKRHGLDIDCLTTHNHWYPKKYCPAYILPHWDKFVDKVGGYLGLPEGLSDDAVADQVIAGRWGSGEERKRKLVFAGYEYDSVQSIVTKKMKALTRVMGDLDDDGKVTAADARLALRAAVDLELLDEEQIARADVDKDGKITAADARMILRMAVGLDG